MREKERAPLWPWLLLLVGAAARFVWLGTLPVGVHRDEALLGYDAWALLRAGVDHGGHPRWESLLDWSKGGNPLGVLLSMPLVAFGGPSLLAIRIVPAVAGVLALVLIHRLARRSGAGMEGWVLLLAVTGAWGVAASRLPLGVHLAPPVILLAVVLFARAEASPAVHLPAAALALTASAYAYAPACFFAVAFFLWALRVLGRAAPLPRKHLVAALVASPLALLPAAFAVARFLARRHPGLRLQGLPGDLGVVGAFLPIGYIPANVERAAAALLGGFEEGAPWTFPVGWPPQMALLTPFLVWGVMHAATQSEDVVDRLMLGWLGLGFITSALVVPSEGSSGLMWLPAVWLSARGLGFLADLRVPAALARGIVAVFGVAFLVHYFATRLPRSPVVTPPSLGEAIARAVERAPAGAPVVVTRATPNVYAQTLFFARTPPDVFVKTAVFESEPGALAPDVLSFDRFRFGLAQEKLVQQLVEKSAWVVRRSELLPFDNELFAAETFGDYATVTVRSAAQMRCALPLDGRNLKGSQDYGTVGIDGLVHEPGKGFLVAGMRFTRGFGVHGESKWEIALPAAAREVSFGIGAPDGPVCSDGISFGLLADGKRVFWSGPLAGGELRYQRVPLAGAKSLTFYTRSGVTNFCDHAAWLRPTVWTCGETSSE